MKWQVVLAVAISSTLSAGQNDDIDYVGDLWIPLDGTSQPTPEVVAEAPLPCPDPNDYVDPFEIYDNMDRYYDAPQPVFSHAPSTPCPTDITS